MTVLDDERLASLCARAGESFAVPVSGPDEILARATGRAPTAGAESGDVGGGGARVDGTTAAGRLRRVAGVAGRHRVLSVAGCIVVALILVGAIVASVRTPVHPTLTAAPDRARVATPRHGSAAAPGPAGSGSALSGRAFSAAGSPKAGAPDTTPTLPSGAVGQPARIEQTGSLALTVGHGDLGRAVTQLTSLAAAYGGFVAGSQTQSGAAGGATPTGSVTLQVPVGDFATVLARAEALGKTSDVTTSATDVTGQYVDLQSRLTALEDSRQQYLSILAKATTVGDILSVQEQLDTVQQQIEQLQGQLQLLASQTTYSKLDVTLSEVTPPARPSPLPESGLVRAWHDGVGGFVAGVEGLIRLAGPLLFGLLLLAAVVTGGRALWRRHQRHSL
jgi:Domain of unknown function (DUF4349)